MDVSLHWKTNRIWDEPSISITELLIFQQHLIFSLLAYMEATNKALNHVIHICTGQILTKSLHFFPELLGKHIVPKEVDKHLVHTIVIARAGCSGIETLAV